MMYPGDSKHTRSLLVLAVLAIFFVGCSGGPRKDDLAPEEKHVLKVASLYNDFRAGHQGKAPRDAQELKDWAKNLKKEELTNRGIEDLDKVFVSPRDNQPYVLVKPEAPMGPRGTPPMVWVYEKTGVDGKRMAAGAMGNAFEMDEDQFKKYVH
jgi:hypothetical protein